MAQISDRAAAPLMLALHRRLRAVPGITLAAALRDARTETSPQVGPQVGSEAGPGDPELTAAGPGDPELAAAAWSFVALGA